MVQNPQRSLLLPAALLVAVLVTTTPLSAGPDELKYRSISDNSILIYEGFPQQDFALETEQVMYVTRIVDNASATIDGRNATISHLFVLSRRSSIPILVVEPGTARTVSAAAEAQELAALKGILRELEPTSDDYPLVPRFVESEGWPLIRTEPNSPLEYLQLDSAIGAKFIFEEAQLSFTVKGQTLRTQKAGASMAFTKDGVLLTDFELLKP